MGDVYDAPNQQVVRPDGSGPADEGTGGSQPQAPEPQAQQAQADPEPQQQQQEQEPDRPDERASSKSQQRRR